jgi:hypothetical protein
MKSDWALCRMNENGSGVERVTVPAASSALAFMPVGTSTP